MTQYVSTHNVNPNAHMVSASVDAAMAGDVNPVLRFVLSQKNFSNVFGRRQIKNSGGAPVFVEDLITAPQARRLIVTYVTAAHILGRWGNPGHYSNLVDDRPNAILNHRGWYMQDMILPPIVRKAAPKLSDQFRGADARLMMIELYKRCDNVMTPQYGVVQSILTGADITKYIDAFNAIDAERRTVFFENMQSVFSAIATGRSVVLMTNDTVSAMRRLFEIFANQRDPAYRPQYYADQCAAAKILNQDMLDQQRLRAELFHTNVGPIAEPFEMPAQIPVPDRDAQQNADATATGNAAHMRAGARALSGVPLMSARNKMPMDKLAQLKNFLLDEQQA